LIYCTVDCKCNTPGVCHQLSNGFELKHDRLSGDEDVKVKPMEMSPNLNWILHPCFTYRPFSRYMFGWCYWNIFMCLTSIPIYISHSKSFMKFEIKKSHEMISYILVGMALLSAWIALLSEWKYRSARSKWLEGGK
jgi:hypothetical protein